MDIYYKKDTLYVTLKDDIDESLVEKMEKRVKNIMSTYGIENLVIDTNNQEKVHFHSFESRYNRNHKTRVIIK